MRRLTPKEDIRDLNQNAGAVAASGVSPRRAAVLQVDEQLEGLLHDGVRAPAVEVNDEPDAAGVVLVARIVQIGQIG